MFSLFAVTSGPENKEPRPRNTIPSARECRIRELAEDVRLG